MRILSTVFTERRRTTGCIASFAKTPKQNCKYISPAGETFKQNRKYISPAGETPKQSCKYISLAGKTPKQSCKHISPAGETPKQNCKYVSPQEPFFHRQATHYTACGTILCIRRNASLPAE
jgi:hypothetical protein